MKWNDVKALLYTKGPSDVPYLLGIYVDDPEKINQTTEPMTLFASHDGEQLTIDVSKMKLINSYEILKDEVFDERTDVYYKFVNYICYHSSVLSIKGILIIPRTNTTKPTIMLEGEDAKNLMNGISYYLEKDFSERVNGRNMILSSAISDPKNSIEIPEHPNYWETPVERKTSDKLSYILRPFEGPAYGETQDTHMIIPRNTKPRFKQAHMLLFDIIQANGIPMSKKVYNKNVTDLKSAQEQAKTTVETMLRNRLRLPQSAHIDWSSRTYSNNHIFKLCLDYTSTVKFDENGSTYTQNYMRSTGYATGKIIKSTVSFTKEDAKLYVEDLNAKLDTLRYELDNYTSDAPERNEILNMIDVYEDYKKLFENIIIYKETTTAISHSTDISPHMNEQSTYDDDIYLVKPTITLTDTYRFTTSKPNMQGKSKSLKSIITAPKGKKVVSIDISAQDVYFLVWGIMKDSSLKNPEESDPYMNLLTFLKYPATQENKAIIKVPVLSIMNGKFKGNILSETPEQHREMVDKVITNILSEQGYKELTELATNISHTAYPFRQGLFGQTNFIDDKTDSRKNQRRIINAKFQMSSAECFCISYLTMMNDVYYNRIPGLNFDNFKPILPIHDELIAIIDDDVLELGKKVLQYYMLPQVEGWGKMSGKITVGQSYTHK